MRPVLWIGSSQDESGLLSRCQRHLDLVEFQPYMFKGPPYGALGVFGNLFSGSILWLAAFHCVQPFLTCLPASRHP